MSPAGREPPRRWGRGFSADEIRRELARLPALASTGPTSENDTFRDPTWHHYYSEALVALEAPGPPEPGGAFDRASRGVVDYLFSDPSVVQAHFDRTRELLGRPMLLELKVLGLHMLCGVAVRAVRDDRTAETSTKGYRYDTLEGHVEAGAEWFLLSKEHETGKVRFRIQATWREGTMPNWWTRLGFGVLSARYQRNWHRSAHVRLRKLVGASNLPPLPRGSAILQTWQPSERWPIREHEA
jgi:uncharacterized protein (UPF0548 family)